MDFLVTSGNVGERLAPAHLQPYQLDKSSGPLACFRRAALTVFAPAGFAGSLFAGYAICNGRLFHQNETAFAGPSDTEGDSHGVYALLRISPDGERLPMPTSPDSIHSSMPPKGAPFSQTTVI